MTAKKVPAELAPAFTKQQAEVFRNLAKAQVWLSEENIKLWKDQLITARGEIRQWDVYLQKFYPENNNAMS